MTDSRPHALHIGFSKCASTYLRALLRGHPEIDLVFKSGFFTPFLNLDMTFAQYQALFDPEDGRISIESDEHLTLPGFHPTLGVRTTNIAEFEQVADHIRNHLPNVRILMIIRNQASLIVSRYSEYLISGGNLDFEDFVRELMGDENSPNTYYQNYYSRIIDILEDRFPRDNVLVLLQEEMRENTVATSATISSFLGLAETLTLKKGMLSERRSLSFDGMRLLARINRALVRQSSIAGAPPDTRVPRTIYKNLSRIVRALDYYLIARYSSGPSKVLTAECKNRILSHFHKDNVELERQLGRGIEKFGYLSRSTDQVL